MAEENEMGENGNVKAGTWELTAAPFGAAAQRLLLAAGWEPFSGMPMGATAADGRDMGLVPTILYRRRVSPLAVTPGDVLRLVRPPGESA